MAEQHPTSNIGSAMCSLHHGIKESCSFCDSFLLLVESSFGGKTCQLGSRLIKILLDNKEAILENVHHRNEEFADLYDSLEANPDHTSPSIQCKFCTLPECLSHEAYLQHLNQHYMDICSFLKKYCTMNPQISVEESSSIACPICSQTFNVRDPNKLRSWVSMHFYECGGPVHLEKMECISQIYHSSGESIMKCTHCKSPFLHESAMNEHSKVCPKKPAQEEHSKGGESLLKLLTHLTKECAECLSYEYLLKDVECRLDWSLFVKHAYSHHPRELDDMNLDFEQFCHLSSLVEMSFSEEKSEQLHSPAPPSASSSSGPKKKINKNRSCVLCKSGGFSSISHLKMHYALHHYKHQLGLTDNQSYPSKCTQPTCSKRLYSELEAVKHMVYIHQLILMCMLNDVSHPKAQKAALGFSNIYCASKISNSKLSSCPICPRRFHGSQNIKRHLCSAHFRVEILERMSYMRDLTCKMINKEGNTCNKSFNKISKLIVHCGLPHRLLHEIMKEKGLYQPTDKKIKKKRKKVKKDKVVTGKCKVCKEVFACKENLTLHTCGSIFERESQENSSRPRKRSYSIDDNAVNI